MGYGWTHLAGFPDNPAPCDDGNPAVKLFVGPAGAAQCTQCTCGGPQGGSCSLPKVECWAASAGCAGNAIDVTATFSDGMCHKPTNQLGQLGFPPALSCQMTGQGQLINAGACPPSAVDFPNKATWNNQLNVCVSDNKFGGCGAGKACIRKGQGDAGERLCIRKNGTANVCPAGWANITQAYQAGTDTRSCTACQCGNPNNATCNGGDMTFFDADNCGAAGNDPPKTFNATNGCTDVSNLLDFNSWSASATVPVPSGTCQPGGGQPQGQVTTNNAVVFCCK